MSGKVRIGCVGAGYWGKNLVRNFATAEGAELSAVCDADPKVQARIRREYPGSKVVGSSKNFFMSMPRSAWPCSKPPSPAAPTR